MHTCNWVWSEGGGPVGLSIGRGSREGSPHPNYTYGTMDYGIEAATIVSRLYYIIRPLL